MPASTNQQKVFTGIGRPTESLLADPDTGILGGIGIRTTLEHRWNHHPALILCIKMFI